MIDFVIKCDERGHIRFRHSREHRVHRGSERNTERRNKNLQASMPRKFYKPKLTPLKKSGLRSQQWHQLFASPTRQLGGLLSKLQQNTPLLNLQAGFLKCLLFFVTSNAMWLPQNSGLTSQQWHQLFASPTRQLGGLLSKLQHNTPLLNLQACFLKFLLDFSSLNLLPCVRLKGGLTTQAMFGRATSVLLGLGVGGLSVLCLAWGLFATSSSGGKEEVLAKDEITPLGDDRFAWGSVLGLTCFLTLFPNSEMTFFSSFFSAPVFRADFVNRSNELYRV